MQPNPHILTFEIEGNADKVYRRIDSRNGHENSQHAIGSDIIVDHPRPDPCDATLQRRNGDHDLDRKLNAKSK